MMRRAGSRARRGASSTAAGPHLTGVFFEMGCVAYGHVGLILCHSGWLRYQGWYGGDFVGAAGLLLSTNVPAIGWGTCRASSER